MNVEAIKYQLTQRYPGVNLKDATVIGGVTTEIVGEIDRNLIGSEKDVAVVVADRSALHLHKVITEEYEVIKGSLRVFKDGKVTDLKEGEKITIEPGTVHCVEGDGTWFYCYSVPDWFPGDYYLVENPA